ncbi:hypothetical protein QIS74_13731 [Colletotrichum tabaci]|uniref:Uncharacterized protein n=1 Tax=Colletotrichum tabaci TaxID=1209068 RepID=A0AAV9ST01_9PEZI
MPNTSYRSCPLHLKTYQILNEDEDDGGSLVYKETRAKTMTNDENEEGENNNGDEKHIGNDTTPRHNHDALQKLTVTPDIRTATGDQEQLQAIPGCSDNCPAPLLHSVISVFMSS